MGTRRLTPGSNSCGGKSLVSFSLTRAIDSSLSVLADQGTSIPVLSQTNPVTNRGIQMKLSRLTVSIVPVLFMGTLSMVSN